MRTHLECLSCFIRQAIDVGRLLAPEDSALQLRIVQDWAARISTMTPEELAEPAPWLATQLYARANEMAGEADPYKEHKLRANARVLEMLPQLQGMVDQAVDPLRTALGISITGNYIDVGAPHRTDWESALIEETKNTHWAGDVYEQFSAELQPGVSVLIVGDNCGEIGLDTILVKELQARGCEVSYSVRGGAILNDATMEDAEGVGMTSLCRVLSTGAAAPGAVLSQVSEDFKGEMRRADVLISKGQGNFESLEGRWPGVYFALKAKCRVLTREMGVSMGESLFLHI